MHKYDRFLSIEGCLKHRAMQVSDARRRYGNDQDIALPNPYLADVVKIMESKAVRSLANKTQVLSSPSNALIRNRLSHSMEVAAIATTIAQILGLNHELCMAIALAHDIGHTPLGHQGEEFLTKVTEKIFRHEVFGVIVAQKIERKGDGLNLTKQTLLGMLHHSRGPKEIVVSDEMSEEAKAVMYSDKIAYMLADYNDFPRLGVPEHWRKKLRWFREVGMNQRERKNAIIAALCEESAEKGSVSFCDGEIARSFSETKNEMYKIYARLHTYDFEGFMKVYAFLGKVLQNDYPTVAFALMTDADLLYLSQYHVLDITKLRQTSLWERIPFLEELPPIDLSNPDLDW